MKEKIKEDVVMDCECEYCREFKTAVAQAIFNDLRTLQCPYCGVIGVCADGDTPCAEFEELKKKWLP